MTSDHVEHPVGLALTVVLVVAVLLAELVSVSLQVTVAVLVIVPAAVGATAIVTVALDPFERVPILQVTVLPVLVQLPCVDVAETYVTLEGSVSISVTPVAVSGPLLVTVIV